MRQGLVSVRAKFVLEGAALLLPILLCCCSSGGAAKPAANAGSSGGGSGGGSNTDGGSSAGKNTAGGSDAGKSTAGGSDAGGKDTGSAGTGSSGAPTIPPNPCILGGGCPAGTWINVTPPTVNLADGACGNYGTKTVQADPSHPGELYTIFMCQGVWKSVDFGQTWQGPINTGSAGATLTDCAGGLTVAPVDKSKPPMVYASCIRGNAIGFWASSDGGVNWKTYMVGPAMPGASGQQFYPPVVDPYDSKHLLMAGHALDLLIESMDGGETWTAVVTDPAMKLNGGTGGINFLNTGDAATTRTTWLWLASTSGGNIGTWRTTDGGKGWTHVNKNEHTNGATQIYQPDTGGVVFMAGDGSAEGAGVLRSADYGKTWAHVGLALGETIVFGTTKALYSMYGWGPGAGMVVDPALETGAQPGTGDWTASMTPKEMSQGPAQAAVIGDGKNNIILVANYNAGLWRYIEP